MKTTIRQSFDKASETYDLYSQIQTLSSINLVKIVYDLLLQTKINKILDIGSGTGNTTIELLKFYPKSLYTLCDISEGMLSQAQKKIKNANYIVCDAEKYDFNDYYNLGISNLSMQWFESIECFLKKILTNCKYFAFSCLLDSSFREYKAIFRETSTPTFNYPHVDEIKFICNDCGVLLVEKVENYLLDFPNAIDAAKYFKKLGAGISSTKKNYAFMLKDNASPITLNYDVFFAVIRSYT